jgi:plastocyanin
VIAGRRAMAAAVAAVVVAIAGLAVPLGFEDVISEASAAPDIVSVSMKDFAFMPSEVTVAVGGRVTWTYDESAQDPNPNCESPQFQSSLVKCPGHSTTSTDTRADGKPLWDSGVHRADGFPFSSTFDHPGRFHYICTVHGGPHANNPITHMEGDVVVEGSTATSGGAGPPAASSGGPSRGRSRARSGRGHGRARLLCDRRSRPRRGARRACSTRRRASRSPRVRRTAGRRGAGHRRATFRRGR